MKKFSLSFCNLPWQDDTNIHDCGIYTIRHMETFRGGKVENWRPGFEVNKVNLTFHSSIKILVEHLFCVLIIAVVNDLQQYVGVEVRGYSKQIIH